MKFLKKNQVILYVIALMLVVAAYLNYSPSGDLNGSLQASSDAEEMMQLANIGDAQLVDSNDIADENVTDKKNNEDDYFTASKLERDTMYSQMLETYEKVINSSNSLETQKQSATQEITKINETKNKIMICENLIKTKGFENNVIFVNGDSISIVIGKNDGQELKQEEVAQIQNIIAREMNSQVENIHISSK